MKRSGLVALLVAVACTPESDITGAPKVEAMPVDSPRVILANCDDVSTLVRVETSPAQVTSPIRADDPMTFCVEGLGADTHFSYGYPWRGTPSNYQAVVRGGAVANESGSACIDAPSRDVRIDADPSGGHQIELADGTYLLWIEYDAGPERAYACARFDVIVEPSAASCGDQVCAAPQETCDTCALDCGMCPPDVDLCESVACENGTCSDGICTCASGFELVDGVCVATVDPCDGVTCNNGTCSMGICECSAGYAGTNCDECDAGFVMMGGRCVRDVPSGWPVEVPAPWSGWDALPTTSTELTPPGGDDASFTCTGTPGSLAGLTASSPIVGQQDGIIRITANYCVIHDIVFDGYTVRVDGDHYVIRDSEINGRGLTTKNGLMLSGSNGIAYRNYVHHLMGNDRHCYSNGQGTNTSWFIENEGYACSGDGYQAGHRAENNRPTNIYLVRNTLHQNRENGLDYKFLQNVYAVENVLHGFVANQSGNWCFPDDPTICGTSSSGSDGTAIVIGSDGAPIDTFHYRNTIYDSSNAIRIESAEGSIHLEGNVQYDITNRCLALDKDGIGIQYIENECRNAGRGIFQNWRVGFSLDVVGNTFEDISGPSIEYEAGQVGNASTLVNNRFIRSGAIIYNNTTANDAAAINALPGASGNTVAN